MKSANIINEFFPVELFETVYKQSASHALFEITDYHLVESDSQSGKYLISIKTDAEHESFSTALNEVYEKSKDLIQRLNDTEQKAQSKNIHSQRQHYSSIILGEYADCETASQIFPQLVCDYLLQNQIARIDELKASFNHIGDVLGTL